MKKVTVSTPAPEIWNDYWVRFCEQYYQKSLDRIAANMQKRMLTVLRDKNGLKIEKLEVEVKPRLLVRIREK